ncbi:ABC transporter substrate-binding protein [Rugamonas apoptosis]|uniref:ABC transporter substrate-binding protein n=1 Tax=Rugamonas apoptosis TaxID=2758570 RepID=A0A7W2FB12_9BURK|nr:ABC transporter substrate-binding protein [Rugamonas apoptosis]MBA5688373.1 ABC transporter substrate-binding protein [Rugamonas apoptosis]
MKRDKQWRIPAWRLLLLAALCLHGARAHAYDRLVYPLSVGVDSRYEYDWAVLRMALDKSRAQYGAYSLHQATTSMSPARITQELLMPTGHINILVRATAPELEQQFTPVRIPVDRGLLGYRVFLVRRDDLPRFAAVRSLNDLRPLRAGLGKDWSDVPVLRAAGLPTEEGSAYEGLFSMLEAGRFDYFSRGADEALREYGERRDAHPKLAIEPILLLHYPLPRYFFLRRDAEGKQLAARIAAGMEIMVRDGSLNTLFQHYKGATIAAANLRHRRVLTIPNPTLSPQTPLSRSELWYNPLNGK